MSDDLLEQALNTNQVCSCMFVEHNSMTCTIYLFSVQPSSSSYKLTHAHTLQSSAIVGSTLLATIEQLAFNVLAPNEDGLRTSHIGMG